MPVPEFWPLEEEEVEPAHAYCFLRLQGRLLPSAVGLAGGAVGEGPDPTMGAMVEAPVDRDVASRAVDATLCTRLAD